MAEATACNLWNFPELLERPNAGIISVAQSTPERPSMLNRISNGLGFAPQGLLILPCKVPIVPHGSRWVWISLYRLLPLVWKVPIVPHCHVSSRVTLLTVLLSIWVFHFLSIQTTGKQSCSKYGTQKLSCNTFFFFR